MAQGELESLLFGFATGAARRRQNASNKLEYRLDELVPAFQRR